jgi:ribosomal protein L37AE/L43A
MSGCAKCGGPDAIHYLGAGIWACFRCWAALIVGGRKGKTK